ncbi:acetyltransferase [Coemansia sp. RSA 1813]|nr:Peroxygenase 1 [Coemansia sp. RSA 1646]KAJ1772002.1 acetyltransferase [Coemansia sp. RSA 1843]KAJ2089774.1 acetyltransferase [Coemansia sp. RSA 986]KAJ2210511.1 acetyltransferase [Coemansia sp. RSA 487]KAJ2569639.1 acetyltransferase [Coemansia sp. RSA 1813]
MSTNIRVVPATEHDITVVLGFIKRLAEYEKAASHEVEATEDLLLKNLFGPHPYAHVLLAYVKRPTDNQEVVAGFALYFFNFSTWKGRPGLYLEDLFVDSEFRGFGIGKRLLAHLAAIAKKRECGRMEWVVLDWNEPAIRFYESLGARQLNEWIINRVAGQALGDLAEM